MILETSGIDVLGRKAFAVAVNIFTKGQILPDEGQVEFTQDNLLHHCRCLVEGKIFEGFYYYAIPENSANGTVSIASIEDIAAGKKEWVQNFLYHPAPGEYEKMRAKALVPS